MKYVRLSDVPVDDQGYVEREVTEVDTTVRVQWRADGVTTTQWFTIRWHGPTYDHIASFEENVDGPHRRLPKIGDRVRVYTHCPENNEEGDRDNEQSARGIVVEDDVWWYATRPEVELDYQNRRRANFVRQLERLAQRLTPDEQAKVATFLKVLES